MSLPDAVVNFLLTLTKLMLCNLQKQHAKVKVQSRARVARFKRVLARDRSCFAAALQCLSSAKVKNPSLQQVLRS